MATHFVGFRDDRYSNAVRIWGKPDFIHYVWDLRAQIEIMPGDTVVFANGDEHREPSQFSGPELFE